MGMKKKLFIAGVAVALASQSTASVAQPATWGLCWAMPQWMMNWVPCFPAIPGQRVGQQ
jgi:hypothetical protein